MSDSDPNRRDQDDFRKSAGVVQSWIRQAAQVFEFLAALGAGGFVGHRIDERSGSGPWGLLVGLLLGMAAGLYLMLRESKRLEK
jgi:F0F1-type ATP synthase assembly protein I